MSARAKGSAVHATLAFVGARFGEHVRAAVVATLSAEDCGSIRAVAPTEEVPYALMVRLWEAVDATVPPREDMVDWADAAGADSIGSTGVQLYGGILRKPTPREFLTQSISLFRLYYHPGDMEVVEDAVGRAVLRLVGFDPVTGIFCRRLTGGLRQAIALAGGEGASARHVRCAIEGDAFCEWELRWQRDLTPVVGSVTAPAGARAAP